MKSYLLFYMCHLATGLTVLIHCYETTVFLHLFPTHTVLYCDNNNNNSMHFSCIAINPTRLSLYWTNKKTGQWTCRSEIQSTHLMRQMSYWCRIHSHLWPRLIISDSRQMPRKAIQYALVHVHCVPKKHVTTFSMISWSRTVRLERFLAHLLLRVQAIDGCFYFPTSPISCCYFTLGNCQDLNISKNLTKSWKFHWKVWFWLKISICQSSMVHEGCWGNCPTRVGNFEASTVCWIEATRRVQLSRFQGALDRVCRVAVKNLVLSQEDKPKRHRSAR